MELPDLPRLRLELPRAPHATSRVLLVSFWLNPLLRVNWLLIIRVIFSPAYGVNIKGTMAVANVEYSIAPKTPNDFTSLVALYTPLKCSAATLAAFTGAVLAVVGQMAL